MAVIGLPTNEGLNQSIAAMKDAGYYIKPTRFAVSDTAGPWSMDRTKEQNPASWYSAEISGFKRVGNGTVEFVCTIPPGAAATSKQVREIQIFCQDSEGNEFFFAFGQPGDPPNSVTALPYFPTDMLKVRLQIIISPLAIDSVFEFVWSQAQEIEEHNENPDSHPFLLEILARNGIFAFPSQFKYRGQWVDGLPQYDEGEIEDGDWVYKGSDGKYHKAIVDEDDKEKQRSPGKYETDANANDIKSARVIFGGLIKYDAQSEIPIGSALYLSDTEAGKGTSTRTSKTLGISMGDGVFLVSAGGGDGITDPEEKDAYEKALALAKIIDTKGAKKDDTLIFNGTAFTPTALFSLLPSIQIEGDHFIEASGQYGLKILKGTSIRLGEGDTASTFALSQDMLIADSRENLDTGSTFTPGKDYYVYLCKGEEDPEMKIVLSLNATFPTGYTAENSRKIGGFHTLCVAAGTLPNFEWGGISRSHPLSGFPATAILPRTVWDLKNRASCENEGMFKSSYIPNLWVDIYLMSGTGTSTASAYQGVLTRNRQYHLMVEEDLPSVGKRALYSAEFTGASIGSNQQTSVNGANEAGATTGGAGGRVDTANRRMLSADGGEEFCGSLWQVLADTAAAGAVGSIYGQTNTDVNNPTYGWINMTTAAHGPFTQQGGRGSFWGLVGLLIAGGAWNSGASCGSSARNGINSRSYAFSNSGCRGCAPSRVA